MYLDAPKLLYRIVLFAQPVLLDAGQTGWPPEAFGTFYYPFHFPLSSFLFSPRDSARPFVPLFHRPFSFAGTRPAKVAWFRFTYPLAAARRYSCCSLQGVPHGSRRESCKNWFFFPHRSEKCIDARALIVSLSFCAICMTSFQYHHNITR